MRQDPTPYHSIYITYSMDIASIEGREEKTGKMASSHVGTGMG